MRSNYGAVWAGGPNDVHAGRQRRIHHPRPALSIWFALKREHKQVTNQLATLRPASKTPTPAQLTAAIDRHLQSGVLEFNGKAPKPADILTQTTVNKRPFSYTAIVLKSDPSQVIIKKVLTGGFVPARPGDGSYSQPVPLRAG